MGDTVYLTATSIDGFIADPANSLSWLFEVAGSDDAVDDFAPFFAGVGAMAMGATTYEWLLEHEGGGGDPDWWHKAHGDTPCWVFTHRALPDVPGAGIRFVSGPVAPVHADMTALAGDRDLWIVGGGELVGQFDDAGLLTRIVVSVAPVTLGSGAPLLPRRITSERLSLTSVRQVGQFAESTYVVGPRVTDADG